MYGEHHSEEVAQALRNGMATAVSNGSYKEGLGSSATIIHGGKRAAGIVVTNRVQGPTIYQSAYRSKLAGCLASLITAKIICQLHNVTAGSVTIGLDSQEALRQASSSYPPKATQPDFNILTGIRGIVANFPIGIKWTWIKGHQDKHHSFRLLSTLEQDNVLMDSVAKWELWKAQEEGWHPSSLRTKELWQLEIDGAVATHFNMHSAYLHAWQGRTRTYWAGKRSWDSETTKLVDWSKLGWVFSHYTSKDRRNAVKMASGIMGTGRMMKRWKVKDGDRCPCCNLPDETNMHILTCPSREAKIQWAASTTSLDDTLTQLETHPGIQAAILDNLRRWRMGMTPRTTLDTTAAPCVLEQHEIGWELMLYGFVGVQWQQVQEEHYRQIRSQRSAKRWTRMLIRKLILVSWDMWRHRNGILHGTSSTKHRKLQEGLQEQAASQFAQGLVGLLQRDHHLLNRRPLSEVQALPVGRLELWAESIELARTRFKEVQERTRNTYSRERNFMRSWLSPQSD